MYFLNVFPLEEQYINNAKLDEIIIDPRTGHITICTASGTSYISNSKDMEADLNGLLSLKDRFYKEYLLISDLLEDAINKLSISRENISHINSTISDCRADLIKINELANNLMSVYDSQYKKYNSYLFNEMENFRMLTRENTKRVIIIDILLDEIRLLVSDINEIRKTNSDVLQSIKTSVGL